MPKLLYLVTEDWFFVSHFLPMARTAKAAGFEVVVATRVRDHAARIAAEGCRVVSLENERRSFGPFEALRGFFRMVRIVREERPDIVHCIALRMVVLGGLAARFGGAQRLVLAPTGLGHVWSNHGPVERVARALARFIVGRWLKGPDTRYLFENTDDPREFGLDPDKPPVTIVPGAGVDPDEFAPSPEPAAPPVRVAVVARMIAPKGIAEAVAAARKARALGAPIELHLYGAPDPSNRRSCTRSRAARMVGRAGHRLARPLARRRGGLAREPCRDAAHLVSRGRAAQPDRGGGLRPPDRDDRCARLPRSGARPARGNAGSAARQRGGGACFG